MWSIRTPWFDVALTTGLLLLGHLCFGRFEDYKPRWRRILKCVLSVALIVGISLAFGRFWMYAFFAVTAPSPSP